MSSEADRFRVELERLKSKYKREALRAIAAASEDAYERGRKDERASSIVQSDLALKSASGNNAHRDDNSTRLVQHVMEHIYRGLKEELLEDSQLSVQKLKAVLRNSAETVLVDMPASLRNCTTTENQRSQQEPQCIRIALPQRHLQIHTCGMLQKVYLVRIMDVTDNVVKGLFLDGQYVSYSIETDVLDLGASAHSECLQGCNYRADRRASEVKAIGHRINKELPLAMIPPVPGRNHKVVALSRNPQRPGKQEQKAQYRRRLYAMWLQYTANVAGLRGAPGVEGFLGVGTAPERLHPLDSATATAPCATRGGKVSGLLLHREAFASAGVCERGPAAARIAERTQAFLHTDLRFDFGDTTLYTEPVEDPGSSERDSARARVFALQSAAFTDLRSADRELQSVQPRAAAAVEACRELLGRWCELSFELRAMGENLVTWRGLEPADSVEHTILGAVTDRLSRVIGAEEAVGAALQTELLEPMEFLHVDCVQAARDCVDETLRRHPPATFVSPGPYFCAEEGRHRASGLADLRKAQEGIAAAGQTATSWDACRRLRGAMTVQQLLRAADHLAEQHRVERLVWEECRGALRRINVTTAVSTEDDRDSIQRDGDSSGNNSDYVHPSAPALQSTSECLRQVVQSELQGMSEASEQAALGRRVSERDSFLADRKSDGYRPKGTNDATHGGESATDEASATSAAVTCRSGGGSSGSSGGGGGSKGLAKALGGLASLKSVRALFTRATVPSGRRRSPSVCRPTGLTPPSDEDALAAHYNARRGAAEEGKEASPEAGRDRKGLHSTHEPDALLQQDQRQYRVAARRQATAHGNVYSAAHTSGHIRAAAVSQAPAAEAFGAAPAPAPAVQIHPVFASSDVGLTPPPAGPQLPSKAPTHAHRALNPSAEPQHRAGGSRISEDHTVRPVTAEEPSPPAAAQGHDTGPSGGASSDSPVPSGWVEVPLDDGTVYYYHSVTRVSRWDKPADDVAAALEARIQQANAQVDEALQRHKEERLREQQMLQERESQADQLKAKVKDAVDLWAYGRAMGHAAPRVVAGTGMPSQGPVPRDLVLLLSTLHQLVPYISGPEAVISSASLPQPPSASTCPPSEVKKAYMRAVRFVHPDKLPDDITMEARMRADAAFIILTDEFNKYRSRVGT